MRSEESVIDLTVEPNSKRYWRLNSIAGLRMQYADAIEPPVDPEEMVQRQNDFATLRKLEPREAAVIERAKRIFSFRSR